MSLLNKQYSALITAAGTASVIIKVPSSRRKWTVQQVSVKVNDVGATAGAPPGATSTITLNGSFLTAIIPTGDSAAGDPPILLYPADTMTVSFTGCTSGAVASVLAILDEEAL